MYTNILQFQKYITDATSLDPPHSQGHMTLHLQKQFNKGPFKWRQTYFFESAHFWKNMRLHKVVFKNVSCLNRNAGVGVGVDENFHIEFMLLVIVDQLKFSILSVMFPGSVSKSADPTEK